MDYRKTDPMVDEKTMFSYEVVTYASDIERGKKGSGHTSAISVKLRRVNWKREIKGIGYADQITQQTTLTPDVKRRVPIIQGVFFDWSPNWSPFPFIIIKGKGDQFGDQSKKTPSIIGPV